MGSKVTFSPFGTLLCILGFGLGLLFYESILGFIKGLGTTGTPTENIIGPLFANGGMALAAGIVVVILSLLIFKKFVAFIICVLIGVIAGLILTGMGIPIPDPGSFLTGLF